MKYPLKHTFMNFNFKTAIAGSILTLAAGIANAAVVQTVQVSDNEAAFDAGVSASLSTLATVTAPTPSSGNTLGLNDGTASGFLIADLSVSSTWYNRLDLASATITLDLDQAYNITSISALTGWAAGYFGSQIYTVSLEVGNSGTFTQLVNPTPEFGIAAGKFGTTPYIGGNGGYPNVTDNGFAVLSTITDSTGTIANNVTGVRLVFSDPYPTLGNGGTTLNGTVIRELSITGTAVPEPSFLLLSGFGVLSGLLIRRRRN